MAAALLPATVRTNLGVLRAVLNAAVEADLIGRSPVRGIRLAKPVPPDRPMLTPEELLRLADAIGPRYRGLVLVGGTLGLRWSEAIGLRVADVNFLGRSITGDPDDRRGRGPARGRPHQESIFTPHDIGARLPPRRAGAAPCAVGTTRATRAGVHESARRPGPLRRTFLARSFKPAVAAAGLDPALTFHGLRHVATSLMVEAGEHPRVIQQRLGHATARLSMELYAHVPEAADRQVAARLDERFASAAGTQRARAASDEAD